MDCSYQTRGGYVRWCLRKPTKFHCGKRRNPRATVQKLWKRRNARCIPPWKAWATEQAQWQCWGHHFLSPHSSRSPLGDSKSVSDLTGLSLHQAQLLEFVHGPRTHQSRGRLQGSSSRQAPAPLCGETVRLALTAFRGSGGSDLTKLYARPRDVYARLGRYDSYVRVPAFCAIVVSIYASRRLAVWLIN